MPVKVLSRGLCLPDLAAGDNEIEQHRNFSETHFPGVAPCRFRLVGHDGGAVWDCRPNVCCPAGGAVKWQLGEWRLLPLFSDMIKAAKKWIIMKLSFEIREQQIRFIISGDNSRRIFL